MSHQPPALQLSEDDLRQGIRTGDERSFRVLFDQYYPVLVTFAHQYTHDVDQAKELAQEVFVQLYQKRETLTITSSLKSYLFKMTYHACLKLLRKHQTRQHHHQTAAQEQPTAHFTDSLIEAESIQRIHQAIERLPEQCCRIFTLNRFEGMNNQAIADHLGLSKRTVETQISKALKLLRQTLFALLCSFMQ